MKPGGSGQFAAEYRTVRNRWISAWGRVSFSEQAQPERFIGVMLDVTERKRLTEAVEASRQEIRALAAQLLKAQEEERTRVSRELHDQICQQLASLAMEMGGLASEDLPEGAKLRLRTLQARVVKASAETRHIAYELHPSVLEDLGVAASLQSLCDEFSNRLSIPIKFKHNVERSAVPREVAACLYRVAQESLNNIAKHAKAKHISASLTSSNGKVTLSIADDGAGFELDRIRGRGTLGLIGMEERARLVDGKLSIESKPGHGTRIALEIPLSQESV